MSIIVEKGKEDEKDRENATWTQELRELTVKNMFFG